MFVHDESAISDLHKDAYGFRPSELFWVEWENSSESRKQEIWDIICEDLNRLDNTEQDKEEAAIADFEKRVEQVMEVGQIDRKNAIRWISGEWEFDDIQSVEKWVWRQGFLSTPFGKKLVSELCSIYGIKE